MKLFNLNDMIRGWFIGNFEPNVVKTTNCEVGIKKYVTGEKEKRHVHYEADEVTVIVSGKVKMNGIEYSENDIILIPKDEDTDFECVEDSVTVVFKSASVAGDKYILTDKYE